MTTLPLPATQTICPAFGGPGLGTLFCTSARHGLSPSALAAQPAAGMTLAASRLGPGREEPRAGLWPPAGAAQAAARGIA